MSEFLDFLKHKFAYVAIGEFKPGKFTDEAIRQEMAHLFLSPPKTSFYQVCSEISAVPSSR